MKAIGTRRINVVSDTGVTRTARPAKICDGQHLLSDRAAPRGAAVPSQGESKPVMRRIISANGARIASWFDLRRFTPTGHHGAHSPAVGLLARGWVGRLPGISPSGLLSTLHRLQLRGQLRTGVLESLRTEFPVNRSVDRTSGDRSNNGPEKIARRPQGGAKSRADIPDAVRMVGRARWLRTYWLLSPAQRAR
jgi:hypothetical protein